MSAILLFLTLSVTVEGLVQYVKTICSMEVKSIVLQLSALAVAVLLCILTGADLFAALGIPFAYPAVGCILTGVFASRGANYANDILSKLNATAEKNK